MFSVSMGSPEMHKAACNHGTLAVNPHSRCDRCIIKAGDELCTPEARCHECSELSDKDWSKLLAQRRKNEGRRKSHASASPARSEASYSSTHSSARKRKASPTNSQALDPSSVNKDLGQALDFANTVITLESDSDHMDAAPRTTCTASTSVTPLPSFDASALLSSVLFSGLFQPPVSTPVPRTMPGQDAKSVNELKALLQAQSSQLAWYQSQLATQRYPAPTATLAKPPGTPTQDENPHSQQLNEDSLIPPSGHVPSTTDQAPEVSDADSDLDGEGDSDVEADAPAEAEREAYSGGEDYDVIASQQNRKVRRLDHSDNTDEFCTLSRPLPMRVMDTRSPRKSRRDWSSGHSAGRRPIRTPSPPDSRSESPAGELNVTDNSSNSKDFSFRKVLKTIASLSGAKAGPPLSEGDSRDFPLHMRSQVASPPQESLVALETTQAVVNAIRRRQTAFEKEDLRSRVGKTLARLHNSLPSMNIKPNLYRSMDGALPMEALSQPNAPAM